MTACLACLSSSVARMGTTFPGFMMFRGSSARLIPLCASRCAGPCSASMCFIFPTPTPCSPDAAPPNVSAYAITSSFNFSNFSLSSSRNGTRQWKFPSAMCAHITHGNPACLNARSVSETHSVKRETGTHTSPTYTFSFLPEPSTTPRYLSAAR